MTTSAELDAQRPALTALCVKLLGAGGDADDAVQETLVRAWRGLERFDGNSSLKTWLHRIATNVCLDMLGERAKRWRPVQGVPAPEPRRHWAQPVASEPEAPSEHDPDAQLVQQQQVRLAFVAALQHLPAKQRAALLLAEVLGWSAQEIADALEISVPAVNSALQRARATLTQRPAATRADGALSDAQQRRLDRYLNAFCRDDAGAFAGLLQEDAGYRLPSAEEAWAIRFRCWRGCLGKNS